MDRDAKLEAIRLGYIDGHNNTRIAAALGTTKNAVLGLAWTWKLNADNAHHWVKTGPRPTEWRARKKTICPKIPMSVQRARLANRARDAGSRAAVDMLNALPMHDCEIAEELGVSRTTLSNWRRGQNKVTAFMQQCVADVVARLGSRTPGL